MGNSKIKQQLHDVNNEIDKWLGEENLYKGKINHLAFLSQQKERKEEDLIVVEIEIGALKDEKTTLIERIAKYEKQPVGSICQSEIRKMRKERYSVFLKTIENQIEKLQIERDALRSDIEILEHSIKENNTFIYARLALIDTKLKELYAEKENIKLEISTGEMSD